MIPRSRALVCAIAIALPGAAWGQGIRNSAHDLSNTSGTTTVKNQEAQHNQICIYCHTPHHAQSTQLLWNHSPTANSTYTWGNDMDGNAMTKSSAGTMLPTALRAASRRCLGCHDGSVAIGDVSNAGGGASGVISGLASIVGETDASGKLINAGYLIGTGGNMGGNHPISIPYAGQTYNGVASGVTGTDVGPSVLGGYYDVVVTGCTSPTGVCTSAPGSDGRNGAAVNLIPDAPGGTTSVGVECTSCHEPHNKFGYAALTRVDVGNASGLCRSCHNK